MAAIVAHFDAFIPSKVFVRQDGLRHLWYNDIANQNSQRLLQGFLRRFRIADEHLGCHLLRGYNFHRCGVFDGLRASSGCAVRNEPIKTPSFAFVLKKLAPPTPPSFRFENWVV